MLLALLSQVKGVPKDYSVTYLRRWMAIHLAKNVDYFWVKNFYMLNTFIHRYFPGKVNIETSNLYIIKSGIHLEKSYIEKSHFFTGKVLVKMLHVKTGIFLEKSYRREHRNFKLIYNYQVFSWKSQKLFPYLF